MPQFWPSYQVLVGILKSDIVIDCNLPTVLLFRANLFRAICPSFLCATFFFDVDGKEHFAARKKCRKRAEIGIRRTSDGQPGDWMVAVVKGAVK